MSDWKEVFDVTVEIFKVIDGLAKKQNVEENEKIKRQTLNRFLSIRHLHNTIKSTNML
jgi:hypothetical protein